MKVNKKYIYTTLLALPVSALLIYILNPPQCPVSYTQEQINTSRCVVGADIGGGLLSAMLIPAVWLLSMYIVEFILNRKRKETPES